MQNDLKYNYGNLDTSIARIKDLVANIETVFIDSQDKIKKMLAEDWQSEGALAAEENAGAIYQKFMNFFDRARNLSGAASASVQNIQNADASATSTMASN